MCISVIVTKNIPADKTIYPEDFLLNELCFFWEEKQPEEETNGTNK